MFTGAFFSGGEGFRRSLRICSYGIAVCGVLDSLWPARNNERIFTNSLPLQLSDVSKVSSFFLSTALLLCNLKTTPNLVDVYANITLKQKISWKGGEDREVLEQTLVRHAYLRHIKPLTAPHLLSTQQASLLLNPYSDAPSHPPQMHHKWVGNPPRSKLLRVWLTSLCFASSALTYSSKFFISL